MIVEPFRVFIGQDSREPVAAYVLAHSILKHASQPVSITFLQQPTLRSAGLYSRERGATESTEFSLTRFLVPSMVNFQGQAIFMDCDMLCNADIIELFAYALAYPDKPVLVCQHDYSPKAKKKFLNQQQTVYPRKNWSSLMVFNANICRALTPAYVNSATGLELHRFQWLQDDQIGSLPLTWNHLVGEYKANPKAECWHYTLGGPWFQDYAHTDHADEWRAALADMTKPATIPVAVGA